MRWISKHVVKQILCGDKSKIFENVWTNVFCNSLIPNKKCAIVNRGSLHDELDLNKRYILLYKGAFLQIDNNGCLSLSGQLHIGQRHNKKETCWSHSFVDSREWNVGCTWEICYE